MTFLSTLSARKAVFGTVLWMNIPAIRIKTESYRPGWPSLDGNLPEAPAIRFGSEATRSESG
ncbi:hypothetical protein MFUM_170013 [Methylacidiphilum fumariolicum SolV]|uniref:Uncharacterized protein n=1 Tax=Methylacidiphilum fumariolicum (strain SolV) TaxID=1156937 RepID=I0JWI1_METFB|nr:hypothetical protein MFUM_170013 [Methylacidiphilum fumariolicum SolV]